MTKANFYKNIFVTCITINQPAVQCIMVDRNVSLSDSELDFTDGVNIKLDTLPRHSHFFNPPSSNNTLSASNNSSRLSISLPVIHTEGRIDLRDPIITRRKEQHRQDEEMYSFDNRLGLAHDLGFLATMPELCDVTFLVGEDRQPVCGVRAILAARSK